MLGRLFGNAASSLSSPSYQRDSVVDEEYTRSLLYPEHSASQDVAIPNSPATGARVGEFDDWSGLELDALKDLRTIVAQDALGDSEEPCILFDTQPNQRLGSPVDAYQRAGSLQNSAHRRGGSTTSPLKPPSSPLFPKSRQSVPSTSTASTFPMRNRSSTFSGSSDEHDPRYVRVSESREDTKNILNCAFGSSAGASSGTKMHVLSAASDGKEPAVTPSSPGLGGSLSAGYFRKREPMTRAHTSGLSGIQPSMLERAHSSSGLRPRAPDAILITKLFSVNLPEPTDLQSPDTTARRDSAASVNGSGLHMDGAPMKGKKLRAKKTPVFAIVLVVQLPTNISIASRPPSRSSSYAPVFTPGQSIQNTTSSRQSSVVIASLPRFLERGDVRVNALVEHWDIIDRALMLLENVCAPKILESLKEVDNLVAALVSKPSKPKEKAMQRTNQLNIYLNPLALNNDLQLKSIALEAVQRIRRALRIPRVIVGQGRWGLWNDELIRIARCYGGKEQSLFIPKLLTAFLGAHASEWVTSIRSTRQHRRGSIARKDLGPDAIYSRTVILSNDRSIARRLVFLLSSFLAGNGLHDGCGTLPRRNLSSVSLRQSTSHSPLLGVSKHADGGRSPKRHHDNDARLSQGGLFISRGLQRKGSDVHSIKSIPIPTNDPSARKSSAATTSTVTPNPTTPVPQFSAGSGPEATYFPNESSASASLNRIWRNSNRDSESSTASTKWGSLLSGFWSRDSSANPSENTAPSATSSIRVKKGNPLDAMVQELSDGNYATSPVRNSLSTPSLDPSPAKASQENLQVNADDGVIDVEIAIPGFLSSSTDSVLASPPFRNVRHTPSSASFNSHPSPQRHFSPAREHKVESRVAGYLPKFHPDYSLQAVRANKSEISALMDNIKGAMLSEPHPKDVATSGWVDVCTTLIANVQTFSIKRLRLKRKISRLDDINAESNEPVPPEVEPSTSPRRIRRSSTTASDFVHEEAFSYESVTDIDPLLSNALDRILSRDSALPSRSNSPGPLSHSRQPSTGSKISHIGDNKKPRMTSPRSADDSSRGISENLVVDALEDVVKSVNHDLKQARNGLQGTHLYEASAASPQTGEDNALREGVKTWLLKVENTAVW
jgi:Folliculin-interacting protein N-terminus